MKQQPKPQLFGEKMGILSDPLKRAKEYLIINLIDMLKNTVYA